MKFFVAVPVQGEAENIFQVLKDGRSLALLGRFKKTLGNGNWLDITKWCLCWFYPIGNHPKNRSIIGKIGTCFDRFPLFEFRWSFGVVRIRYRWILRLQYDQAKKSSIHVVLVSSRIESPYHDWLFLYCTLDLQQLSIIFVGAFLLINRFEYLPYVNSACKSNAPIEWILWMKMKVEEEGACTYYGWEESSRSVLKPESIFSFPCSVSFLPSSLLLQPHPQWIYDFANPSKKRRRKRRPRRLVIDVLLAIFPLGLRPETECTTASRSATIWSAVNIVYLSWIIQFFKGLSQSSSSLSWSVIIIRTLDQLTFLTRFLLQLLPHYASIQREILHRGFGHNYNWYWWIK